MREDSDPGVDIVRVPLLGDLAPDDGVVAIDDGREQERRAEGEVGGLRRLELDLEAVDGRRLLRVTSLDPETP